MTTQHVDLGTLSDLVIRNLPAYSDVYSGLGFGQVPPFVLTLSKPNTARTVVPVSFNGVAAGDLTVIAFMAGDGTGDESRYKVGELAVHPDYNSADQWKILPRSKEGIIVEGWLPLFAIAPARLAQHLVPEHAKLINTDAIVNYVSSLHGLVVDNLAGQPTIMPCFRLGTSRSPIHCDDGKPTIYLTTGYLPNGARFGDPHSIFYPASGAGYLDSVIQVGGFLAIKSKENPLFNVAARWSLPEFMRK